MVGVLDVGQQVGSTTDEMEAPSEKVPCGSHLGRIDVGLRKVPPSKERGDLECIDLVVLGFSAMDGLHVEGVAKDELDLFSLAQIRQPIPGEDALDGDDEIVPVGLNRIQEILWSASHVLVKKCPAFSIENAEVHGLGVQIDPAVVVMCIGVESHGSLLDRLVFCFQPAYFE